MEVTNQETVKVEEAKPLDAIVAEPKRPSLDDIETGEYTFEQKEEKKEDKPAELKTEAAKIEPAVVEKQEIQQPKKYKLKIDGIDTELTEEEVIRFAQMGKASHKRFEEAASIKKQVEPILKALKEDPYYLLTHPEMGVDEGKLREATEKWLAEKIMFESLPQDQQQLHLAKKELETIKKQQELQRQAEEQAKMADMEKKYAEDYERQFLGALEKVNVPKEPRVIARMAEYMSRAVKTNTQLSAEDAALLVKEDLAREQAAVASKLTPEELVNFIGKENADKVRKYFASQVKNVLAEEGSRPREQKDIKKQQKNWSNIKDFKSYLDKLEGY
jgi:hypothetical protein